MRPSCLALFLAACGATPAEDGDTAQDSAPTVPALTLDEVIEPGTHGVGTLEITLTDDTRTTPANGTYAGADDRTIVLRVWYPADGGSAASPADDAAPAEGAHPLLVHSHGFMSDNNHHGVLGPYLASHGTIFAAPRFPLSNLSSPGGATVLDLANQPGDVSFVIDQIVAGNVPVGTVDSERIGLSGLSLGGFTALLTAMVAPYQDERASLVVTMAASSCFMPATPVQDSTLPTLLMHGDSDAILPYDENATPLFDALGTQGTLLTFAEGSHTGFTDVTADLLDSLDHADSLGCTSIAGALPDADDGDVTDVLDVQAPYLGGGTCSDACATPPSGVAMRPARQIALSRAAIRAFLAATWDDDDQMNAFVQADLAAAEDDLTVSHGE